jgi:protein TonB
VAFVFVVGALAYAGWWKRDTLSVMSHLRSLSAPHSSVPQAQPSPDLSAAAERDEKANQPTPALPNPVNQAAPANPGNQATPALPNPENQAAPATATSPADSRAPAEHHVPAPESLEASQVPEPPQPKLTVSPKIQPLEVKTGRRLTAKSDAPAPPALPVSSTAPGNDLSGIVSSGGTPAPILRGTLRVSQGVSQGLLIKKVAPVYPPSALQLRKEGSVELLATVSKTGAIKNISVLSGDPSLAEAAASAVRQWKDRPYLLNSEPVEIETQITIRFRLPN